MSVPSVCVVVAAFNAEDTIATAIRSALREPEVAEVVVVDDASTDNTAAVAHGADDGSGRLSLIRVQKNGGPARARNVAIARSAAPFISMLDADDFFMRGRFAALFRMGSWDMAADNIAFFPDGGRIDEDVSWPPDPDGKSELLDAAAFVAGNISRRGAPRAELGFLKPVMRRAFLDRNGLRYREDLRLGEDYEIYTRALICGAQFRLTRNCGYGAVTRTTSLSSQHGTQDLRRLADADRNLLALPGLPRALQTALRQHEEHVRAKYQVRRFLDAKARSGLVNALLRLSARPADLARVLVGVGADKLHRLLPSRTMRGVPEWHPEVRMLLPAADELGPK